MTDQEKSTLCSVLLRLIDDGQALTPLERRDLISQMISGMCDMTADEILAATQNNRKLRVKRGTTTQNDTYTGAPGEITMDTDANALRIHDGTTPGGHPVGANAMPAGADYVVESQLPTAANNYTWYRKYASGWVEQGGHATTAKTSSGQPQLVTVTLPVQMSDNAYSITLGTEWGWPTTTDLFNISCGEKTQNAFKIRGVYGNASTTAAWGINCSWCVYGVGAQ